MNHRAFLAEVEDSVNPGCDASCAEATIRFFYVLYGGIMRRFRAICTAMRADLKTLLTPRFLKFCTVGASGVVVNLGFFFLFSDVLGVYVHLASACAIEISILSNFAVNEIWTFRDRRESSGPRLPRALRFHAVSLVGGVIQWCTFAVANALILRFFLDPPGAAADIDFISRYVTHPVDVGKVKYLAQSAGIGMATLFNFFANVHWTWGDLEKGAGVRR